MRKSQVFLLIPLVVWGLLPSTAFSKESIYSEITHAIATRPHSVPADGTIEVAFSPKDGATELAVKAISSGKKSILVVAYSFIPKPIARP